MKDDSLALILIVIILMLMYAVIYANPNAWPIVLFFWILTLVTLIIHQTTKSKWK